MNNLVEHRTGDLFGQPDLPALAQGVNCLGRMGAGIAVVFRRTWTDMFMDYSRACETGALRVGGLHVWRDPVTGTWIYNLASQHYTGRDARLDAIESSLTAAVAHAEANEVTAIGFPRIGAGIGGLDWGDVLEVFEKVAVTTTVRLVVVSLPDV